MKDKQKPSIRFKGFTEAWEQCKFSDLVLIERGGSPRPIDDFITEDPNGLNWIKIGDAPEQGNYITKTAEKIKLEGLSKTRQVQPGDLILSNSMSFGKPYIMAINGCIHDGWLLIRDTQNNFDLKFLCHLLGTPQMIEQYKSFAAGSTVNNLNKELVGNTLVTIPIKAEQDVLGKYFEHLDHLITLHQRKYDKLVNVKQSMLKKMFPQDGKNAPDIRFSGFTEAWEQRKLGDVCDIVAGGTPSTQIEKYWFPKEVPWLSSGEVHKKRIKFTDDLISEEGFNNSSAKWVKSHSVLIALAGQGKTRGTVAINEIPLTTNQSIAAMIPTQLISCDYLFSNLEGRYEEIRMLSSADGSRGGLNKQMVSDITILMPNLDEQQNIGSYFKQLDNLITLHQRELEKLQNIKKSCLEKMFV